MRRAAKVDATHGPIRDGLRQYGWLVADTARLGDSFVDLVGVAPRSEKIVLFEVKASAKAELTPGQKQRISQGWPVYVVWTLEQALAAGR